MVAHMSQRQTEYEDLSSTERLFKWIGQMRTKKIKYLRNRHRNIRVEAVLGHALSYAEQELRNKQYERIRRWQELKSKMASSTDANNNCSDDNSATCDANETNDHRHRILRNDNRRKDSWNSDVIPELQSLDKFMSELGAIKSPLQR